MIAREVRSFLEAWNALSAIKFCQSRTCEPDAETGALKYLPAVGLILGTVSAVIFLVAALVFPEPIPVAIAIGAGVALTGARGEAGFARVAGGSSGLNSAIAAVLLLGLKAAALMGMDPVSAAKSLVAAFAGARLAPMVVPYAASPMLGAKLSGAALVFATLAVFVVMALLLAPTTWIIAMVAALMLTCITAWRIFRSAHSERDRFDALEQVYETGFLLVAAAVIAGPG